MLKIMLALGLAAVAGSAASQTYPTRPIRLIIPFPPGASTNDILGRLIAQRLTESLGQQIVVDNRPGAGGNMGSEAAAKAAADGYTLLIGTNGPIAISPHVYTTLGYDPLKDLAPVSLFAMVPYAIIVNSSVKATNLSELIALAKASPGRLTYASSGSGSTPHLCGELLRTQTGIDITHVPYKGGAPAAIDLLGGQVQVYCPGITSVLPHVTSGKLRALAVTMPNRTAFLPNVSTSAEQGFPQIDVNSWVGLLAPARTPGPIINRIHQEVAQAVSRQEVRSALEKNGAEPAALGPVEFARFLAAESSKWAAVAKAAKLQID
jgi:tripartite-type tricarboxylate transporter receptor subunit TctC